jgi:aspartate carbamoyltransferase regulatory subunit
VLVVGADAPDATNAIKHDLQISRAYHDSLPEAVRRHLSCRVVDRLETIVQAHTIEGLTMGVSMGGMAG